MKTTRYSLFAILALFALAVAGCKFIGENPSAPSAIEHTFYDVQTNIVERVVLQTNVVEVPHVVNVFKTNEVGVIASYTNVITIPQYSLVTVTQQVEAYVLTPKQTAKEGAQAAGTMANLVVPGSGGLVTGIALALLGAWGKLRSYKGAGQVLTQNVQTLREVVKSLPDGAKYDEAVKAYLRTHQQEAGVVDTVAKLITEGVSNQEAVGAATEVRNLVASLK